MNSRGVTLGFSEIQELAAKRRLGRFRRHLFDLFVASCYVGVHFFLMLVVVGKRGVDLCQRKMRVLEVHFFRAPAVGELVQDNFDHLCVGASDPGDALIANLNLGS